MFGLFEIYHCQRFIYTSHARARALTHPHTHRTHTHTHTTPARNLCTLSRTVLSATADLPWGDFALLLPNLVQELVKLNYYVAPDKRRINVMNSNVMWVVVVFADYIRKEMQNYSIVTAESWEYQIGQKISAVYSVRMLKVP